MFEWKDVVSASGPSPFADSIAVDNSENVYVIGYFNSAADFDPDPGVDQHAPGGDADSFLSAFDSAGTYKWTRTWGGSGDSDCFAECAVSGDPDGVYVGGEFSGEVDFDPGAGFDIHTSTGLLDSFLSRFNSLGDHQWTRTWGGSGVIANVDDLKVRNAQTVVAEGYALGGTVDLDPGPGVSEYDASEWIRYLSWFNSSGAYSHSLILDPSFDGSAFDQCDNIYTVGAFQLTVDFNPGPGVDEHTSNGDRDVFLTKYLPDGSW
jgi:hypothetical protein